MPEYSDWDDCQSGSRHGGVQYKAAPQILLIICSQYYKWKQKMPFGSKQTAIWVHQSDIEAEISLISPY